MDARLHPEAALGLSVGDCHMIRNAGGRVSKDALRSLAISQQLLGTNEIYVIHHTDCGMVTFKNEDIRALLKERLGAAAGEAADAIDFLPFPELRQSVIDDVAKIKNSPLINPGVPIVGAIYDVKTGKIDFVASDETPAHA
jgi:carbonic anhydrase